MSPRSNRRRPRGPGRRRRSRLKSFKSLWRFVRYRWRDLRRFLRAVNRTPPVTRFVLSALLLVVAFLSLNWIYHAVHKPTEILFPLDNALDKGLADTWREYGDLFREHSTAVVTPDLLAALAQTEGSGNPVARTYWRWRWSTNPLEWYQPASSAVGMFQITDGTFQLAKRYCIHDHAVAEDGPWHDLNSCWFNGLYSRVLPSHAIEMTAALLDRQVALAVGSHPRATPTPARKQELAAVIHLCGAGAGRDFVRHGFRLLPHQRCGDHDARTYVMKVTLLKQQFAQLAGGARTIRAGR